MSETSDTTPNSPANTDDARANEHVRNGDVLLAGRAYSDAGICFEKAHQLSPLSSSIAFKLGTAHYQNGNNEQAIIALTKAHNLDTLDLNILNTLGAAYGRSGRITESILAFGRVFEIDPSHAAAAMNCGRLLLSTDRTEEAEAWLAKAASLRPKHAETLQLLTEARLVIGQPRSAVQSGELAHKLDPENFSIQLALGQAYLSIRKLSQARDLFLSVLEKSPDHPQGLYFLAETEEKIGRTAIAKAHYMRVAALDIDPDFRTILELKSALTLPVISQDGSEIGETREEISKALDTLPRGPVADPYRSGGFTNFYLAYQGENDKDLQQRIAAFYLECCPTLAATAPHIDASVPRHRYRIGIVSSFLRNHTVGHLCRGMIEHLDRQRFEVVLLRCPLLPLGDPFAPVLEELADQVINLPDDLKKARDKIASVEADLIYFPEIGMEDLVYFLAFARSAPVQVMGWGHPVTSGIPNVDAFLSVADMEPENANEHYTERLIQTEGLSICMEKPAPGSSTNDRSSFGMDESQPAYLCAQSLYKIHPDFDKIIAGILEKDAEARIYFLSIGTLADEIFLGRLKASLGQNIERVKILPRVPTAEFTNLLGSADILLDIPQWAGGKTSLESLAAGTPIVHWPGAFMRGRHTLAFYKKMGVTDCLVDSAEAYVETAYRLVHDQGFKTSVREKIKVNAPKLFNDSSAIDEISDIFERLILESR